jgi:type IV secretory pathway TrbD component
MIAAMRQPFGRWQSGEPQATTSESNIAKISINGDVAGLVVTVGMLAILLTLGVMRWFLAASVPVGVAVALVLRWTARDR